MPQTVEITEGPLARERQAALADVLVRTLGVEREEAELTALMAPCAVGPLASAADGERLLAALAGAGFAARAGAFVAGPVAAEAFVPAVPHAAPAAYAPPAPAYVPPPEAVATRSSNAPVVAVAVVLAVVALGLGAFILSGRAAPAVVPVVVDTPPGSDGGVQTVISEPTDDMMMEGDPATMDDPTMASAAPAYDALPSPPPAPSDGVRTVRLADGQFSMTLSEGGQTWRLPRPLSANTSISGIQRRPLAGRDVVQFEARDGRWATTYFWEFRQGLLHFVGQDGSGTTNVSEAPGSRAVVSAALGYVPGDDVVRGSSRASRAPARAAPRRSRIRGADTPSAPNIIVMGSYQPYDQAGLDARYAQAQQTGLTLQVVPSETYGMTPGLTVIVAGPYDRATALRLLDQVRVYVPDAFRNALD